MQRTKKWFRDLFRRRMFVMFLLLLQLLFIIYVAVSGSNSHVINTLLVTISIIAALHVVAKKDKGAYKLTWVFLLLLFPLFGGLFYLLFQYQSSTKKFSKELEQVKHYSKDLFLLPKDNYTDAIEKVEDFKPVISYLHTFANFPVYNHTKTSFLSSGENFFEQLLKELIKAEKYIFLEYFIINEGIMWNKILEILKDKIRHGVEVRIIYDDFGCFLGLPNNYSKVLEQEGIKCVVFNKFKPFLTTVQNNRDHRKLAIIDGKVAFTGGINLADEYINKKIRFGHWKDAAVKIEGEAAWSFTLMFLQLWSICKRDRDNYLLYYPWKDEKCRVKKDGFVQPYADSPMDNENVGEHVYLHIINNAKRYVYINTPYLIIDDSMVSSLTLAAKSGVDVRITVPHIADKKLIHFTTRSYYRDLIKAGVKIYEYKAGFIHSKSFICDDIIATMGTTNLDFRSLYLHFECGCCMYDTKCIKEMKEDFVETLSGCKEITLEDCKGNIITRFIQDICRLFAPLM